MGFVVDTPAVGVGMLRLLSMTGLGRLGLAMLGGRVSSWRDEETIVGPAVS